VDQALEAVTGTKPKEDLVVLECPLKVMATFKCLRARVAMDGTIRTLQVVGDLKAPAVSHLTLRATIMGVFRVKL
jgi:hypothetical protein